MILIILLATFIGVIYLHKVRSYDIYEKEPFFRLLGMMILGGIISIITSLIIYAFVEVNNTIIDAIFKIGLIEELSKLFALVVAYKIIEKDFDEIVDGIIYITAVSLGFSVIENIFYAFSNESPIQILLYRSIFATVGHISFSGYMGIAFFVHKKLKKNYLGIAFSVALASLAHGLYDGVLFHQEVTFLFTFVYISLIALQIWLLRISLGFSTFRKELSVDLFAETSKTVHLTCNICEKNIETKEMTFWKIRAGVCGTCNSIVLNSENTSRLFKYFRPTLRVKKFFKRLPKDKILIGLDPEKRIVINTNTKNLTAGIPRLSLWLKETNEMDKNDILRFPVIGIILKYIGLRYLV